MHQQKVPRIVPQLLVANVVELSKLLGCVSELVQFLAVVAGGALATPYAAAAF